MHKIRKILLSGVEGEGEKFGFGGSRGDSSGGKSGPLQRGCVFVCVTAREKKYKKSGPGGGEGGARLTERK